MATAVHPPRSRPSVRGEEPLTLRGFFGVFRYSRRALELAWSTNRPLTVALGLLTLLAGILPALVAVVELGRLRFGGLMAWLAWMALHITVLIGFRNRLAVLSSWIYSYVFFRRGSRLITRVMPPDQP